MSKIEKALRRARTDKSLVVIPGGQRPVARESGLKESRDLVAPEETSLALGAREASTEAIAQMRETALRDREELVSQRIILPESAENSTVQAFREMRTKILQKTLGRNAIIMVTSVSSEGGSSFVSTNLAVAFAFDAGKTALLVDCNLRNPGVQRLFADANQAGMTDYLEHDGMDIAEIIHPVGIERLRVVPAGKKREIPSEYFTSERMRRLLDSLRRRYAERFIILDAPPMSETADTQILAELCDYIVLVVPYGKVTTGQLDKCIKALDSKKLIGTVFNNEPLMPGLDWKDLWRASYAMFMNRVRLAVQTLRNAVHKK